MSHAHSDEERGAFPVTEAALPVFSSGYFYYPGDWPRIQEAYEAALFRRFGVYLQFHTSEETYAYEFEITPLRFATGPKDFPNWDSPTPTPPFTDPAR
jgi:hypothetical protein